LKGDKLLLIDTDGCPGLPRPFKTVYPRPAHQRCWAHKMRKVLEKVRKRITTRSRQMPKPSYLGGSCRQAEAAARSFCKCWRGADYPSLVRQLERDLPELLAFYRFPKHIWRKLAPPTSSNVVSLKFAAPYPPHGLHRQRVLSGPNHRIIYSIFQRFNLEWKTRTLRVFTHAA
jgi:hypothetical protein